MRVVPDAAGMPIVKGPYSPAVIASGPTLYVAGQGPVDPETGTVVGGEFEDQAARAILNLKTIVEQSGASLVDAIKVNVYLADITNWAAFNEIFEAYFPAPRPVRTTIQAGLPLGFEIEIDAVVAMRSSDPQVS